MKTKLIKKKDGWYNLYDGEICIGSTHEELQGHKLSLKNCQAIERGWDLDELAIDCETNPTYAHEQGFIKGFQKALELMGDKKFSEEDVRRAIEIARMGSMQEQHNGYGRPTELRFVLDNISSDEIIQSLQQTEWDVEIEMENSLINGYRNQAEGTIGFIAEYEPVPKLDTDGCLILKKI